MNINMEELQRLEELKKEAIENPLKKKRGCKDCKKKADQPIESLPEPIEIEIEVTAEDIKLALDLMVGRPNEKDAAFINWVYLNTFGETIPQGCGSCGQRAYRQLLNHYNRLRGVKG
jgi:hypothetical protein